MPRPKPLPVIRVAPLGDLKAYSIYEHELDSLAAGTPSSHLLSISYALIPFAGALAIAIFGTEIPSDRTFNAFALTALVTGLGGAICFALGINAARTSRGLVAEIKSRMPPLGDSDPTDQPTA